MRDTRGGLGLVLRGLDLGTGSGLESSVSAGTVAETSGLTVKKTNRVEATEGNSQPLRINRTEFLREFQNNYLSGTNYRNQLQLQKPSFTQKYATLTVNELSIPQQIKRTLAVK